MHSWPLFDLMLVTPGLCLRLAREEELDELARASVGRVLHAADADFMDTDWTQLPPNEYERSFMQYHWRSRADWTQDAWSLQLVGFDGETPVGAFGLMAERFRERRSVKTGSWLLPEWRRKGLGTQARHALLQLAFAELDAVEALTEAHPRNAGSLGVSFALGYEESAGAIGTPPAGGGVPRVQLRLPRERWAQRRSTPVEVVGLSACRAMFGAD